MRRMPPLGHRLPVHLAALLGALVPARLPALLPALALLLAACQPVAFVRPDMPVPERWPRQAAMLTERLVGALKAGSFVVVA